MDCRTRYLRYTLDGDVHSSPDTSKVLNLFGDANAKSRMQSCTCRPAVELNATKPISKCWILFECIEL